MFTFLFRSKGRARSEITNARRQLEADGFCVLERVLSIEECDAISASFDSYVINNRSQADNYLLATNRHSRLCNMHMVSAPARRAIAKPRVMGVLDHFFGDRAYVATSLYFEQSSEQAIHRDTPFFHTKPRMIFAGVWFALEDVHPDAGPLRYVPGGHRISVTPQTIASKDELGNAWTSYCDEINKRVKEMGLSESLAFIKKGDCFIWHPELPHGGSPIKSPGMTRKSMVFHCAPESTTMYGAEEFFGLIPFAQKFHPLVDLADGRKMINHGAPMFAHNS
jgi:ectoine hydroxylase-related dioxygenase (phytanoyl-CoA dioxygenase family)